MSANPRRAALLVGLIAVALVAAAAVYLWTQSKPTPEPGVFRVGYQPTMLYLPVFVAQERGFFSDKKLNVELVKFGSANEMAQALATGRIEATGMSSLTVLANLEQNSAGTFRIYLVEVITAKLSPDALVVPASSQVRELGDLRGKRLGLHPGTTLRAYAEKFLVGAIGQDHGVTFVPLPPELQVQALASGTIDALYSLEPIPTLAVAEVGAREVSRGLLARYVHDPFYAGAGVLNTAVLQSKPAAVAAYRAAVRQALEFIASNEEEARALITKYEPVSVENARRMSLVGWVEPASVTPADWHATVQALVEMQLMPAEVALDRTFLDD